MIFQPNLATKNDIEQLNNTPDLSSYPGIEFLYYDLNHAHKDLLNGKYCQDGSYGIKQQGCLDGTEEAINRLIDSPEYKNNYKLNEFIIDHANQIVYLRLFFLLYF